MGDYDLKASYSADNIPLGGFSGNASFNGCAIFSGQVKTSGGIEAKLEGHIRFIGNQIMLNFLKRVDDESHAIEFYACKTRDNSELLGFFSGLWRYRWAIRPSPGPNRGEYIREILPTQDWITDPSVRENKVSIEFLPFTPITQTNYPPEISGGADLETATEKDLKTAPAL